MTHPLVSVIMPVYNGEKFLSQAIESILCQSMRDFEFIIVDDGSTDDTWEIVSAQARQDSRINLVRNANNEGLMRSLNTGLALARGEFIARQDADDVSMPDRLQKQNSFLQAHPDIGVVGTASQRMGANGENTGTVTPPQSDTALRWRLLFGTTFCHPSIMLRRGLLREHGIRYRLKSPVEDYDFLIQLSQQTRMANLSEPLYRYRIHDDSTSTRTADTVEEVTAQVSAQQLQPLLPNRHITVQVASSLRRCYFGKLRNREDVLAGTLMMDLFSAFASQPHVDMEIVEHLRKEWVKRFVAALPLRRLGLFLASDACGVLMRKYPVATSASLMRLGPARAAMRLRR